MSKYYVRKNTPIATLLKRQDILFRLNPKNMSSFPSSKELQSAWTKYQEVFDGIVLFGTHYSHGSKNVAPFVKSKRIINLTRFKELVASNEGALVAQNYYPLHTERTKKVEPLCPPYVLSDCNVTSTIRIDNPVINIAGLLNLDPEDIHNYLAARRLVVATSGGRIYEQTRQKTCGRYYAIGVSLQNVSRVVRHIALSEIEHCDIDQSASAWNIACNMLLDLGADVTHLRDFVAGLMNGKNTRNKLTFGGKRHRSVDVVAAASDWRALVKEYLLFDLDTPTGRTGFSYHVFRQEAVIQRRVEDKLFAMGHFILSSVFDGCLITGTVSNRELTKIENEIKEEMGLVYFKLKNKGRC